METNNYNFGNSFERIFVVILAILTALTLIYLAVQGPLMLGNIKYKTADLVNNQLIGQDLINLVVLSPILLIAGIGLFFKKSFSKYLLMMTPLFLIYYALSYTIGWEWSSSVYTGNNEKYMFYFLFVLISSIIFLMYSLSIFPKNVESNFKKLGLLIYSVLFILFQLIFGSMWVGEVLEVIKTGTTRAYDIAPTAFWLVRVFDLGFTIPLGIISVYLLWARPQSSYPIQFMFYGFFFTMIIAVNAMGIMMLVKNDPTFLLRDLIVFLSIAVIIFVGFVYVMKNYKI
ncbi:MAG: hypothetical protein V1779_02205 [bacterium]